MANIELLSEPSEDPLKSSSTSAAPDHGIPRQTYDGLPEDYDKIYGQIHKTARDELIIAHKLRHMSPQRFRDFVISGAGNLEISAFELFDKLSKEGAVPEGFDGSIFLPVDDDLAS